MRKVTLEQKREAVQIAIAGGDPIGFLEQCGSRNADLMWRTIRDNLKEADPDTFAQLPEKKPRKNQKQKNKHVNTPKTAGEAMENLQDAADEFFEKCEEMGLKLDKEETEEEPESVVKGPVTPDELFETFNRFEELPKVTAKKIFYPMIYDGMTIREVEGGFGRYRRSDVNDKIYIDFEPADGFLDTLSYTVEQWRSFRKEHERAAEILGVEL